MAAELRKIVQKAHYNVNELVLSKNLIPNLVRHVKDLKMAALNLQKESAEIEGIIHLLKSISEIEVRLKEFVGQFGVLEDR